MEAAAGKRFSIKTKIFCCIIGPALILIVVIYLDYVQLGSLSRSAEHILAKNHRSIKAAVQVKHLCEVTAHRGSEYFMNPQDNTPTSRRRLGCPQ